MIHSQYWLRNKELTNDLLYNNEFMDMYLESIKQFVTIITDADILIKYSNDKSKYSNKNVITISRNINSINDLDSIVAMVLQYSSIIEYSDINLLNNVYKYSKVFSDKLVSRLNIPIKLSTDDLFAIHTMFSLIFKFIEYRRVDKIIISKFNGYAAYYKELYNKHFYNSDIDTLLLTYHFEPNIQSYTIAIVNIMNKHFDNIKLPNISMIKELIDIDNINRLESIYHSLNLTKLIVFEVLKNISFDTVTSKQNSYSNADSTSEMTENEMKRNEMSFSKLTKYINSEVSDIKLHTKSDTENLNYQNVTVDNKNFTIQVYNNVKPNEYENKSYSYKPTIEKAIRNSKYINLFGNQSISIIDYYETDSGMLNTNKLHKLLLNDTVIFKQFDITENEMVYIHISLDMSSSIKPKLHEQQLYIATLISSAALLTKNVKVKLSLRYTTSTKCKLYFYNINKTTDFSLLYYIQPNGGTSESLCYPLIFSDMLKFNGKRLFITFTDGIPQFNHYTGDFAINHSKKIWLEYPKIHKLAYFIGTDTKPYETFCKSYPNNRYSIPSTNQINIVNNHIKKIIKS